MLSRTKLTELYRALRDEFVLSVYVDGEATNPAERLAWRKRLDQSIAKVARGLEEAEDSDGKVAFGEALALLDQELGKVDSFIPDRGWVGFATPERMCYASAVPVPMPDLVRWERGVRVAPYVRALKQQRPVVLALVDSQHARIFRYRDGRLGEADSLEADTFMGDLSEVGSAKRASTNTGRRGDTATDAARRFRLVEAERLMKRVASAVAERAGDSGFAVIGGTPEAIGHAVEMLPKSLGDRIIQQPSLRLDMSDAEVRAAAEESASTLSGQFHGRLLDEVMDLARASGRGVLGREGTEQALREQRVETLLMSRSFVRSDPDYADRCVGAAFEQQADAVELSDPASARLDGEAGGVAARLRYVLS